VEETKSDDLLENQDGTYTEEVQDQKVIQNQNQGGNQGAITYPNGKSY
jgi:hypothetical protein